MQETKATYSHLTPTGQVDHYWSKQELYAITRSQDPIHRLNSLNKIDRDDVFSAWLSEHSNPDSQISHGSEYDFATFTVVENLGTLDIDHKIKLNFISTTLIQFSKYYQDNWDTFQITKQDDLTRLCIDHINFASRNHCDFIFDKLTFENKIKVFSATLANYHPLHLLPEILDKFQDTIAKLPQEEFEKILATSLSQNPSTVDYILSKHPSNSHQLRVQLVAGLDEDALLAKSVMLIQSQFVPVEDLELILGSQIPSVHLPNNEDNSYHYLEALELITLALTEKSESHNEGFPINAINDLYNRIGFKLNRDRYTQELIEIQNPILRYFFTIKNDPNSNSLHKWFKFHETISNDQTFENNITLLPHAANKFYAKNDRYAPLVDYGAAINGYLNEIPDPWKAQNLQQVFKNPGLLNLGIASLSPQMLLEYEDFGKRFSESSYFDAVKTLLEEGTSQSPNDVPHWFQCVVAESKDQRVVMALLRGALIMHLAGSHPSHEIAQDSKECSRWLLGKMIGVDLCSLLDQKELSENSSRELYLGLLELNTAIKGLQIQDLVQFSSEHFTKQSRAQTLDLIHKITTLINLNTPLSTVRAVLDPSQIGLHSLLGNRELHGTDIKEVLSRVSEKLTQICKTVLDFKDNEISVEQLNELEKRWGNLEPFLIMQGYLKNSRNHYSLSPLKEVILHSVQGTFPQFKYQENVPTEEKQLGFLSPEEESAWRQNPSRLQAYSPDSASTTKDYKSQLHFLFQTNILPHIEQLNVDEGLIKSEKRENLILSLVIAYEQNNTESLIKICKAVRDQSSNFDMQHPSCAQMRSDLKQLLVLLDPSLQSKKGSKNSIHFCTITDDPNLMIKIGRIVQAASCQDYLIGSFRNTLPAYVIDANIKGAVAFSFNKSDFIKNGYSPSEYDSLFESLQSNPSSISYEFNPALQVVQIEFQNKIFRILLPFGVRRNILRLGENENNKPDIFVERPYLQNFDGEVEIAKMLDALIKSFRDTINTGKPSQFFSFPPSRNRDGGVYSDAARGAQTGAFFINLGDKDSKIPELLAS